MFEPIRNAWKIADLRKKIFYTLFILLIYRIGSVISVPFVDVNQLQSAFNSLNSGLISYMNILAGGALEKASIFALGIGPYINASIIIQLLTVAIPLFQRWQKDGEIGQKKLTQVTRWLTIVLGVVQGYGYYQILGSASGYNILIKANTFTALVIIASFVAGSTFIMWLGEQINEKGIGNGISMILFASIVSSAPRAYTYIATLVTNKQYWIIALIAVVFVAMIWIIVAMNDAERRLSINYAKRVVGRKMYGGQNTNLPIKLSMSGVLPIIFASTIVQVPNLLTQFWPNSGFAKFVAKYLGADTWPYAIIFFLLIIAFNYFYVSIQYDPVEIANNLQKNGGAIPGIRPGQPTADYIMKTLSKVTLVGAIILGVIALVPVILTVTKVASLTIGGTSIMILVSVILETMKQLESQMLMRHYKGFLE